ncbi:MAG TPA: PAS domain-containing protein [Polyangiaceae bacterium]|nr:PAS domain-containing protein [Polyangiaceae bacterium]
MENSAPQAERMDDGERSSADALRRITELQNLEQQVALAVALGLGYWEWDVPTGAIRALAGTSPFLGAGLGGTPMTSSGWAELVHPDDLLLAHRAFEPCLRGERDDWLTTLRIRQPSGSWQWMEVGGRVVERAPGGSPARVLGVVQDNKARKLAEDAVLRDAELLSKVSAAVICSDMEGIVTYWNEGASRLYGFSAEERLGQSLFGHYDAERRPLAEAAYREICQGRAYDGEWQGLRKDGSSVWVEARVSMFRDAQGRPAGVIGISHDISERKRADAERRHLEQQLFQAQKMETVGTLAGGIAHDFNNILTAILVHAELGLNGELTPARTQEAFCQIRQASLRAKDLVKRILTFTRPQEPERRLVSATELLRDAAKFARAIVPSTIDIQVEVSGNPGEIWVDSNQFHQVVLNLVSNASQAMSDAQGLLSFRLEELQLSAPKLTSTGEIAAGLYLLLTVRDNGAGMDEEAKQRAFEPFFTTKGVGEGTGLGLSIVQGIVQSHGGGVELASSLGVGTTLSLYWPATAERAPLSSAPPSSSALRGRGQRVLVVDDEHAVALAARLALESLGYVAKCVTSAEEFFEELALRSDYDLALIDHTMPRLTGLDVAIQLRAAGNELPIIVASGDGRHLTTDVLKPLGRAAALRKPFEMEQLAEAVYRLLRRGD